MSGIFLFPTEASTQARGVDTLYFTLVTISAAVVILVFGLMLFFSIRYRAGSAAIRTRLPAIFAREVEVGWTVATLFVFLGLFWWASVARLLHLSPPPDALNIRVVAKQWMWKVEHPSGAREIDAMHLPEGVPVRLSMTSQDVIHSFYVPAFRVKQDVLPDRITTLWFTPSRLGHFALRCAEYCGTDHALMEGDVDVITPTAYAAWTEKNRDETLPARGAVIFRKSGCAACHSGRNRRGPGLSNLYGSTVELDDGRKVSVDDAYLERSLLNPRADIVKGYTPIMPSYRDSLDDADLSALIAFLKSTASNGGAS
jgi:cytochrome c oxidase subunit 2